MPHAISPERETDILKTKLIVNDGELTDDIKGLLRVSSPDMPMEELRKRYTDDGYVFLKGLLPREDVLRCREKYFNLLSPTGVLKPGTFPVQGIFDPSKNRRDFPGIGSGGEETNGKPGNGSDTAEQFIDLAMQAHIEPWYKGEDFCRHPVLLDFVRRFSSWGNKMIPFQRTLIRNNTPGNPAIGVHYDQLFLRHGEDESAITAWVPVGDITIEGGGLIYLENAMDLGREIEADFNKKANEGGLTEEQRKSAFNQNMFSNGMVSQGPTDFARRYGKRWLATPYEAGDVVLHQSYMIHASTVNHDPNNVIRVGTDLRFVDETTSWDKRWAIDFRIGDGV